MRVILFISVLVMTCLFSSAQTGVSVLTQHNDLNRTGWNNRETVLNHTNVAPGKFGRIGTFNVDDEVYAQPLVVNNITVGNHAGSVLYVATVNNTLYAFNADDVTDTAFLWKVSLNSPGQRAPNTADLEDLQYGSPCEGNYRDFSGRFGIVGTPVIDTSSNTLYVSTKTIDSSGIFHDYINALDLKSGQQRSGSPHLIAAQVSGTGNGSVNGQVSYQAKYQNQRPGLLLYGSTVYVASASYCDWGPYHGWILGFDASSLSLKYAYNTTPNGGLGGIWMAGQGISVGQDGNLYVVTGNGTTTADNNSVGNRSSSLIKLSPQLTPLDWFTPGNYAYLDTADLDYGSDGVLIIPNSSTTISGSKEGISYVVDYNNMGRFDSTNSRVKDTLEFNPNRTGFVHVHGSPVYAQLNGQEFVYAWSESFNMRQFTFDRNTGTFFNTFKQGPRTLDNGMPGAMLSLSSNGQDTSSAIVWACFPTSGNANHQVRPGTFAAYRANDVSSNELWNSDRDPNDVIGNFAKFNSPTVANGKVFVPTFSKAIKIYGVYPSDTANCISNGTGLLAEYFSNTPYLEPFPSTATVTKTEPTVNFNWGYGGPVGISVDSFKARFSGHLQSLDAGSYTFYVSSDDGYRLWINNQLVIDKWINKGPVDSSAITLEDSATITLPKCTKNFIRLEYFENVYNAKCVLKWSGPGIPKQVIPTSQLYPADTVKCISNGTGLLAQYYSNTPSTAPFPSSATVTKTEPTVNFTWRSGGPPGISVDSFKARFSGYVQSIDSGKYTFYVSSDDGHRLWINNQLVLDKWIDQSAPEDSIVITLSKCTKNIIKLEYYENKWDATCILKWSGPGIAKQVIPAIQLYPADTISNPPDSTQCITNGTGLLAQYYSNTPSTAPFPTTATITKTEPTLNFNWGSGGPPGISVDSFKARFTGFVQSIDSGAYSFYVGSDDGYRLWINNQLILDKWMDKSASEDTAVITLPKCTKNAIKLEYYENKWDAVCILKWRGPGIPKQFIPTTQLYPADTTSGSPDSTKCISNGTGLLAQYYSNTPSTAPFPTNATITKTEPYINFSWGSGGPPGISVDSFKARFTGFVQSIDSGAYNFYVSSDDGYRLWINNQLILDKWMDKSASEDTTVITLPKCTKNAIKLEYYENKWDATCTLKWSGPGIPKQIIPTTQLYPADSLVACGDPTGLQSTSITTSSAIVSWTAASNAISYSVDYKLNSSNTWINAASATAATSINLSSLQPGNLYDWRVRATCSGGTGNYVASQFTALTLPTCGDPTGLQSTSITTSSAIVSWTAASNAISYSVDYKLNSSNTWINAASATAATSINLSSLQPGNLYDWRVRATCSGGTGNYVASQFTTLTLPTCGDPTGLQSTSITTSSAIVSWTAASNAISYSVDYKLNSSNTWINAASATAATSINLSSLQPGNLYDWRVRATCSGGTGNYVASQFTTLTLPTCGDPTGLQSTGITTSNATVSWTAVSNAISYSVDYKLNSSNTWVNVASATTSTSINLSSLQSGSLYDWRVRTTCSGGSGNYVASQFTTLTQTTCNAPSNLSSSSITSSGATVSWVAASGAVSYDMQYGGSSSGPWTTVNTTSTSVNITGLSASTIYYWQVRTNCSSGSSGYSVSQFTTIAGGCTDALEPNNTLGTAKAISIGTNVNAEIASSTDVDYYIFSTSGSKKNVKVTLTNLPANYNLALYDSRGNQLATSTNAGTSNETVVYNNNKTATYYVKVYGATSSNYSSTQCYTLQVLNASTTFAANIAGVINNTAIYEAGLKLYPVPASSAITISFNAVAAGKATVTIINQLGQEVYNKQLYISSGTNINNINVSKLASGIYMLKLETGENIQSRKLIINQ